MLRFFLLGTLFSLPLFAGPSAEELVKRVDELFRSKTSTAKVEMLIETPNWSRTLKMRMWTRGMEETFIAIDAPKKDRGIATLRKKKEMWNFFPKIQKVIKVPPSMMMGSWMGSDFTNDDLVKETSLTKEYKLSLTLNAPKEFWDIVLTPREKTPTVWEKIEIRVRKKNLLPVHQIFFNEKGEKVRQMDFKEVGKLGGRLLPKVLEMKSFKHKDRKTTITYVSATYDKPIPKRVFTLRNLKKPR